MPLPKRNAAASTVPPKKKTAAVRKPRATPNGHQLPEIVPVGQIFTDVAKKQWILGKPIGVGGFGRIYAASDEITKAVSDNAPYVIKTEPHENGPLFIEMHFYHRVAKSDMIEEWKKNKKLKFLGMPKFVASGSYEYKSIKYRFMVMERFGTDLQKLFEQHNKKFSIKTVFTVGQKILDILEYIHSTGYIHADIKGSNLLLGFGKGHEDEVYLLDFGLACKYMLNEKHKPFAEDPRKAHDGTIEFTSRDAHIGAHSRRGDLEILGYNMLQWLCGRLPWEDNLKDPVDVKNNKNKFMNNIPLLLKTCFKGGSYPDGMEKFLVYVAKLQFEEMPNYQLCCKIFSDCLKNNGYKNDGKLDLTCGRSPTIRKGRSVAATDDHENAQSEAPTKQPRSGIRKPCGLAQTYRVKRSPKQKVGKATDINAKKVDTSPVLINGVVPTPAMLQVMQIRQQKLQSTTAASGTKRKVKPTSRSTSSSPPVIKSPPSTVVGVRTRQQKRRSSSVSPVEAKRYSTSPDLF